MALDRDVRGKVCPIYMTMLLIQKMIKLWYHYGIFRSFTNKMLNKKKQQENGSKLLLVNDFRQMIMKKLFMMVSFYASTNR